MIMPFRYFFALACVVATSSLCDAQELPAGFKQYKRVHQDALKKIVNGKVDEAIDDLHTAVELMPTDAESHYMLAVAYSSKGDEPAALKAMDEALVQGLPVDRFTAGTKTRLDAIQNAPRVVELRNANKFRPAHGPMLASMTGTSLKIWLRTVTGQTVTAEAWEAGNLESVVKGSANQTTEETDFTAVVTINGLKPNTDYDYAVSIDGTPYREATYRFTTLADQGAPVKFRIAFGGGAGFVPQHEYMWNTIREEEPNVLMLLGDNVYSDAPEMPEMQHYCYYRRQSRPEFRRLVAMTPVFSIWDDHDFGTNDCSGGPDIDSPAWKLPVYRVFQNNWANAYYGGGETQPGCYYDYYIGDVHFIMLDGRYYRNLKPTDGTMPTMLGPVQRKWLLQTIQASQGKLVVLCSPVPWVYGAKGDSKDTWNGFKEERSEVFQFLSKHQVEGVLLMSADRHRSDLWKIERPDDYPLYEFNSSRLTNQHVHKEMPAAIFSYNKKQSFGTVDIDTTLDDPTITYRVVSIDGEEVHRHQLKRSELKN